QVELGRSNAVTVTILIGGVAIGALDAAITVADNITVTTCACGTASGTEVTLKPGTAAKAALAALKALTQATEQATINALNSAAPVRNLLIEEGVIAAELPVTALNTIIAGAELRQLLAKAERLVNDHAFYQGLTDTLWYRDPSLAFKLEKAEEEYQ